MRSAVVQALTRRPARGLVLAVSAMVLAAPTTALAGQASVTSGGAAITFTSAPAESNQVQAEWTAGDPISGWTLQDQGSPITAGAGCGNLTQNLVLCAVSGPRPAAQFFLGPSNDTFDLAVKSPVASCVSVLVYGGFGADLLSASEARCSQRGVSLTGDDGKDALLGTNGTDFLVGGNGDDSLTGRRGKDFLRGQAGDDLLTGGGGRDAMFGGPNIDTLRSRDGRSDLKVYCGAGKPDHSSIDRFDKNALRGCEK